MRSWVLIWPTPATSIASTWRTSSMPTIAARATTAPRSGACSCSRHSSRMLARDTRSLRLPNRLRCCIRWPEMRILHVLDHSIPLQSGYTFRTLAILREQRAIGWETLQLTSPKQYGGQGNEEAVEGWHFYRTPVVSSMWSKIPLAREVRLMAQTTKRMAEIVREKKPDLIHAHSPVLNAIPALRVGRRFGIPVVYEVRAFWEDAAADHGTARQGGLRYRLSHAVETYAMRRADAVTTICEGLRKDIVARGIPAERVTVIPNA